MAQHRTEMAKAAENGAAMERAAPAAVAARGAELLRPIASPAALVEAHREVTALISEALQKGEDYGTIPGTDKPTLLKPGAERLMIAFGAHAEYQIVEQEVDHDRRVQWVKVKKSWDGVPKGGRPKMVETAGESLGLYRFIVQCQLKKGDTVIGQGLASCSTMESKYVDRPRDCENVALKMAEKRALVGAVVNTFGLSNRFNPDLSDEAPDEAPAQRPAAHPPTTPDEVAASKLSRKAKALALRFLAAPTKEALTALGAEAKTLPAAEQEPMRRIFAARFAALGKRAEAAPEPAPVEEPESEDERDAREAAEAFEAAENGGNQ